MVNVCVVGAAGGIGQPLSLLLSTKLPHGSTLSLYDLAGVHGVAADLSHLDTHVTIRSEQGQLPPIANDPSLRSIAKGVDVFVITAGVPRKPGMTRDDLFKVNAGILFDVVQTTAAVSPDACFCIVTNPVNSVVPIAAQVLRKLGVYNKDRLLGVSMLDIVRANKFVSEIRAPFPNASQVPVVGGHSDVTIVPLLSQVAGPPVYGGDLAKRAALVHRIQNAGTEVVKAKAGKGSATLSMAYAGARMAMAVVDGLTGVSNPVIYSFVDAAGTDSAAYAPFFAMPLLMGAGGIIARYPIGPTDNVEKKLLEVAAAAVKKNIAAGETFARSKL